MTRCSAAPGACTNAFFEEAGLRITVTTGEKELVDFLWNLGSRNALIRVRAMSLQPDPSQTRLKGNVELVESFPKKTQTKTTSATTPSFGPVTKKSAAATGPTPTALRTTNAVALKTAAPSTNWFKKLVARFTGSSKATPKTNITTKPKPAAPTPVKTPVKTNAPPKISRPPAPK